MIFKLPQRIALICVTVSALLCSPLALANWSSFLLEWSGASFSNQTKATGLITFDTALLPKIGSQNFLPLPNAGVTALTITVQGSRGADGTYDIGAFESFYFNSPVGLDMEQELIGQSLGNGRFFGSTYGDGGDFNLFARDRSGAPSGTSFFTLAAASGEAMLLTSMRPVPEPTSGALLLAGLVLIVALGRRRRKAGNHT